MASAPLPPRPPRPRACATPRPRRPRSRERQSARRAAAPRTMPPSWRARARRGEGADSRVPLASWVRGHLAHAVGAAVEVHLDGAVHGAATGLLDVETRLGLAQRPGLARLLGGTHPRPVDHHDRGGVVLDRARVLEVVKFGRARSLVAALRSPELRESKDRDALAAQRPLAEALRGLSRAVVQVLAGGTQEPEVVHDHERGTMAPRVAVEPPEERREVAAGRSSPGRTSCAKATTPDLTVCVIGTP